MNADSKRTASWEPGGIPFQELIDKLIHLAFERRTETIRSKKTDRAPCFEMATSGG